MSDQNNKKLQMPFGAAMFCMLFLLGSMVASMLWLDIPIHIDLLLSIGVTLLVAYLYNGHQWKPLSDAIDYGGKICIQPTIIMMTIGCVVASWIACGTVPMIIYWGLKLINPSVFLLTAFLITLVVYGLLGLQYNASSVDSEMVTMMTEAIQENFHMNILLLLPAVAVIVMAICKCPSIPTLMVSSLVAVALAMLVQGQTLSGILNILDSGFSIDTALPEFNRLVNRGGLQSMLWTAALGILGMLYGSIMEKTGLLEALLSKMDPLVKSTGGLVTAVVLTCTLLLMATASQTLAIVVGGRMYIGEFKKKNLLPQTLSRTLEDSGTIISPLVPWSLCGAYMAGTLGVSTISYLPFAMFCWLCPVLAIVYGFTGKFFWKTGEKPSQKIYQLHTLTEAA